MKFKVIKKCYGFLNRMWYQGEVVESKDFPNWPDDIEKVPKHIVPIDEAGNEIVEPEEAEDSNFSMTDLAEKKHNPPDTVNNPESGRKNGTSKKKTSKKK